MDITGISIICLGSLLVAITWLSVARLIRRRNPFPVPHFLVNIIDNPLRRLMQPLDRSPERLGLKPGMRVLEIGPGRGTYTLAAAKAIEPGGTIMAVDIEERIVAKLQKRVSIAGATNIEVRVGDAQALDFPKGVYDGIYAITVFGEIPDRALALSEFLRVLKPGGTLALSEFFPDPDYQPPDTVRSECEVLGFRFSEKTGNIFHYTMLFEKPRK